ncbi:MAG: hypothetical protein HY321_17915 [Armatimonadetes bacterium]|nr:hypothetical protein [Armatimonadota bacterium]
MRRLLYATVLMLFPLVLLGCGNDDVTADLGYQVPVVKSVTANPASLGYSGGRTTLTATVENARPLSAVTAKVVQVQPAAGGTRYLPLAASGSGTYQVSVDLPANTSPSGAAVTHEITVTATDDAGGVSAPVKLQVLVAAADAPPAPQ